MKYSHILLLVLGTQALSLKKSYKIGEDFIDFDEDAEYKEPIAVNLDELVNADNEMLADFDQILASANRNANRGDLNQEMAKGQAQ